MPPVHQVSLLIELPSLVIKAVGDFVANNPAYCSVVHVPGEGVGAGVGGGGGYLKDVGDQKEKRGGWIEGDAKRGQKKREGVGEWKG